MHYKDASTPNPPLPDPTRPFCYHLCREYIHNVAVYQKYQTRLGELKISSLGSKLIISPNRVRYFLCTATLCRYSVYLSTSDLLSFIIHNINLAVYRNGLPVLIMRKAAGRNIEKLSDYIYFI